MQRDENAEAAAVERAGRSTGFQGAQAFSVSDGVWSASERRLQALEMHAVFKIEIRGNHRAVKCRKAKLIEKVKLQSCHVAVSEERLWVMFD